MLSADRQKRDEEGFTLIELLVVIIIIGILAAIAIPTFLNQRQKGYDAQAKNAARNAATALESALTDTGSYTAAIAAQGYKASPTVLTEIAFVGGNQFCVVTGHPSSTNAFVYDSAAGGLRPPASAATASLAFLEAAALCSIPNPTFVAAS